MNAGAMKFRLAGPAAGDLRRIARYTRDRWGAARAERYLGALKTRFQWLTLHKPYWRARPEIGEGVFVCAEQSHMIVFREYDGGIEILRVLHGRMDLKRHL